MDDDFAPITSPVHHAEPSRLIVPTPWAHVEPATIPPRQWLYGRHLIRGFVSLTIAPGGIGKSTLGVAEALSLATGRSLLGERVERSRVWAWFGEDPKEEGDRRFAAACQFFGIEPPETEGRLFVDYAQILPVIMASMANGQVSVAAPTKEGIIAAIHELQIDVLRIDPFVTAHSVPENDNGAVDAVARAWAEIAQRGNCSVELVHHTRKGQGGQETAVEDGRGASALLAAARSARVLNRMTETEASRAGVSDRLRYFRIDTGKSNLAPATEKSRWFHLESVRLANGDDVGVVVPWAMPDVLEGLSAADLLACQKEIHGKDYRQNVQAADWVGRAIARALGLNAERDKERIKGIIKTWLASRALRVEVVTDVKRGKDHPVIRVGQWADE